jgi:hypothetical protein
MEKLTKQQIDEALAAMKKLRTQPAYSGNLPYHNATCYSMSMPTYCSWEDIPGVHVCVTCGTVFGGIGKEVSRYRRFNRGYFDGGEDDGFQVNPEEIRYLIRAYEGIKTAGYDAKLGFNCLTCIESKNRPPAVFCFRLPGAEGWTESYPRVGRPVKKTYKSSFGTHDYYTALSFLEEISQENQNVRILFKAMYHNDGMFGVDVESLKQITEQWGAENPFVERFKNLKIKRLSKTTVEDIITDDESFAAQIKRVRSWGHGPHMVELTILRKDVSIEESCRAWLKKMNDGTSYEGVPWKNIFGILQHILGLRIK